MITIKKLLFLGGVIFHLYSHSMSVSALIHEKDKNPEKQVCIFCENNMVIRKRRAASDPNIKYLCPLCKIGQMPRSRKGICGSVLALRNHFVAVHNICRYTCTCGKSFDKKVVFQAHIEKNGRKRHQEKYAPKAVFYPQYGSKQLKRKGNEQFCLLSKNEKSLKQTYLCRRKVQPIDCVE